MAITEHIEKRRLVVTLGAHEAPASWAWECVRFLRNDDGSDAAAPHPCRIEVAPEDAAKILGEAMVRQRDDIATDTAKIQQLQADLAETQKALRKAEATLERTRNAVLAVNQAMASE